MIDKILGYRSLFYRPKGVPEGVEFFKACKDRKGLDKCFSAVDSEAFKDMVLVFTLKYPKHVDSIQEFAEFMNQVKVASKLK